MMAGSMAGPPLNLLRLETYTMMDTGVPLPHLLYYPYGAAVAALLVRIFSLPLTWTAIFGKLVSALFLTGAAMLLRSGLRLRGQGRIADTAMFLFLFIPMNLIYGASFQNETAALFFIILAWHIAAALPFTAGLFFGLGIVARIHFLALAVPCGVAAFKANRALRKAALFIAGSVLPVIVWVFFLKWATLNQVYSTHHSLFGQILQGRFFDWSIIGAGAPVFLRGLAIASLQLTAVILIPYILRALFIRQRSELAQTIAWLLTGISVVLILPRKVADHPFYLILLTPWIAVTAAHEIQRLRVWIRCLVLTGFAVFSLLIAWKPLFKPHDDSMIWLESAKAVAETTAPDALIIYDHPQAAAMMFYAGRRGWSVRVQPALPYEHIKDQINRLRDHGATWIYFENGENINLNHGLEEYLVHITKRTFDLPGSSRLYELNP